MGGKGQSKAGWGDRLCERDLVDEWAILHRSVLTLHLNLARVKLRCI